MAFAQLASDRSNHLAAAIKRLLAIALLGLLALILILAWPDSGPAATGDEKDTHTRTGPAYNPGDPSAASRPGKSLRDKSGGEVYTEPTHSLDELKSFYLNRLQSDGCSLYEALEMAATEYYRISMETGEVAHRLSFDFEGEPQGLIKFELSGKPFWQAINHLAALAGMTVAERGPPILFTAVEDDGTNITRTFAVPPTFASEIANPLNLPDDPFSEPTPPPSIEETMRNSGILLSPESSLSYDPATSRLTVTAPTRDINRVGSLKELTLDPPTMYQMTTLFVNAPAGTTVPINVYSQERTLEILHNLIDSHGGSLVAAPTVVSRPGRSARVESGTSIPIAPDETQFVGRSVELIGAPLGFQLQAFIQAESSELLDNGEIASRKFTTSAVLPRGSSYIVQSERPEGGTQFLIYTPTEIDPAGIPVTPPHPAGDTVPSPQQAIPLATP